MSSTSQIVESCLFIGAVDCYTLASDFGGLTVALIVAVVSIFFGFSQLKQQHANTIKEQKEEQKRHTKVELFKSVSSLLEQSAIPIRNVQSFCRGRKYSVIGLKPEINDAEYLGLLETMGNSLLAVISKIESHEIINPSLFRTFRFSIQAIHYELISIQFEENREVVLDIFIRQSEEALMYFGDFQICLQNMAYSDVFECVVESRVPIDPNIKVITTDEENLKKLEPYFRNETKWGKVMAKYEADVVEHFSHNKTL